MAHKNNTNLKYYQDGSNMIIMNGEPNIYTNLMHGYNTWLCYFWTDYVSGAYWAQDSFLLNDIHKFTDVLTEYLNQPEDKITIGMMSFIETLKPIDNLFGSHYKYPNQMACFYNDSYEGIDKTYMLLPVFIFNEVKRLLNYESECAFRDKALKEAGLPYINIIVQ